MILISNSPPFFLHTTNPNSHLSPIYLKSSSKISRFRAIKTESDGDNKVVSPDLHRKPIISPLDSSKIHGDGGGNSESEDEEKRRDEDWVDWEDQILEDTVPLVGFVDHHPEFEESRCLFIVRKDGEYVDFSYWKCIKGLIKTNYPLYADSFILKHFRRRSGRSNV
ncbi:hypothetical protein ACHQM5_023983 [Ranunculus cassubicifolius]